MDAGAWIGRVVIAVLVAEAGWGFIVSVTNGLILPLLARTMGGDVQSPLYLGKGDVNVPALLTAVLELCFAGIVAVILNSFLQRKPRVMRSMPVRVSPIPSQPAAPPRPAVQPNPPAPVAPVPAAISTPPYTPPTVATPVPTPSPQAPVQAAVSSAAPEPGQFWSPPEPAPQPKAAAPASPPKQPAKPTKPKQPKEVYYNIVGEPINPTEDD